MTIGATRPDGFRRLGRVSVVVVAGTLASSALGACISDQRYSYWVLNDSDDQMLVEVQEQLHRTYVVSPHTYAALFAGMGVPDEGWSIRLVDERCLAVQSFPIDAVHSLLYVDPTGLGDLAANPPWSHGLRTATSSVLAQRDPPCP